MVAKQVDFHSTTIISLDFLTKIKLHSTQLTQQGYQMARFFPQFFVEKKIEWKIESIGQELMFRKNQNCLYFEQLISSITFFARVLK